MTEKNADDFGQWVEMFNAYFAMKTEFIFDHCKYFIWSFFIFVFEKLSYEWLKETFSELKKMSDLEKNVIELVFGCFWWTQTK